MCLLLSFGYFLTPCNSSTKWCRDGSIFHIIKPIKYSIHPIFLLQPPGAFILLLPPGTHCSLNESLAVIPDIHLPSSSGLPSPRPWSGFSIPWFTFPFCWNTSSSNFLRKGKWVGIAFLRLDMLKHFFTWCSHLIYNLGSYRCLRCKLFSLRILK